MRALMLVVALLAIAPAALACDVCGCAMGGNYMGILPQFHKNFVGMRWTEQHFQSAHTITAARKGKFDGDEHFRSLDLTARFYPFRRVQLMVLLPYHFFHRTENGLSAQNQGLGDLTVLGNYILYDTGDSMRHSWKHTLTIGGGIKAPTGRFDAATVEGETLHENLQAGSGSTDFMLTTTYTVRRGKWGGTADVQARLNTANKNQYQFGNRLSTGARAFYLYNLGKFTLLPNAGSFADFSTPAYEGNNKALGTGGHVVFATMGLDVYFKRFSIGYTCHVPVQQQLGGGRVHQDNRWMTTLNYTF